MTGIDCNTFPSQVVQAEGRLTDHYPHPCYGEGCVCVYKRTPPTPHHIPLRWLASWLYSAGCVCLHPFSRFSGFSVGTGMLAVQHHVVHICMVHTCMAPHQPYRWCPLHPTHSAHRQPPRHLGTMQVICKLFVQTAGRRVYTYIYCIAWEQWPKLNAILGLAPEALKRQ